MLFHAQFLSRSNDMVVVRTQNVSGSCTLAYCQSSLDRLPCFLPPLRTGFFVALLLALWPERITQKYQILPTHVWNDITIACFHSRVDICLHFIEVGHRNLFSWCGALWGCSDTRTSLYICFKVLYLKIQGRDTIAWKRDGGVPRLSTRLRLQRYR